MPTQDDQEKSTLHSSGIQHFIRIRHDVFTVVLHLIGYENMLKQLSLIHLFKLSVHSFHRNPDYIQTAQSYRRSN